MILKASVDVHALSFFRHLLTCSTTESSLTDQTSAYVLLLERHALLEGELEERRAMDVDLQRVRDELEDARNEIAVLQRTSMSGTVDGGIQVQRGEIIVE